MNFLGTQSTPSWVLFWVPETPPRHCLQQAVMPKAAGKQLSQSPKLSSPAVRCPACSQGKERGSRGAAAPQRHPETAPRSLQGARGRTSPETAGSSSHEEPFTLTSRHIFFPLQAERMKNIVTSTSVLVSFGRIQLLTSVLSRLASSPSCLPGNKGHRRLFLQPQLGTGFGARDQAKKSGLGSQQL